MTDNTTDCLRSIEEHALWISHKCEGIAIHAKRMEYAIARLRKRPDWETMAEDELKTSAAKLHVALATVRSVLDLYHLKPVIVSKYQRTAAE